VAKNRVVEEFGLPRHLVLRHVVEHVSHHFLARMICEILLLLLAAPQDYRVLLQNFHEERTFVRLQEETTALAVVDHRLRLLQLELSCQIVSQHSAWRVDHFLLIKSWLCGAAR
jgi:hypothetical protein